MQLLSFVPNGYKKAKRLWYCLNYRQIYTAKDKKKHAGICRGFWQL